MYLKYCYSVVNELEDKIFAFQYTSQRGGGLAQRFSVKSAHLTRKILLKLVLIAILTELLIAINNLPELFQNRFFSEMHGIVLNSKLVRNLAFCTPKIKKLNDKVSFLVVQLC